MFSIMLYYLLGRENRFEELHCQSRDFCLISVGQTLTLLGSMIKFPGFLVGHLVQATLCCELHPWQGAAGACSACLCCASTALPSAGLVPRCPAAPCAGAEQGSSWGKDRQSQRSLVWMKDCSFPGQGRTEGKGMRLSHHLLGGSPTRCFSLPRAYDKVTAWT